MPERRGSSTSCRRRSSPRGPSGTAPSPGRTCRRRSPALPGRLPRRSIRQGERDAVEGVDVAEARLALGREVARLAGAVLEMRQDVGAVAMTVARQRELESGNELPARALAVNGEAGHGFLL